MPISDYYENLVFEEGEKINVSNRVNRDNIDQIHWHPYMEILLSCTDDNRVSVNFSDHTMKMNDMVVIYPGDLHAVHTAGDGAWIIIQFPMELLTIMNELGSQILSFSRHHFLRYDAVRLDSSRRVLLVKEIAGLYYSSEAYKEVKMYSRLLTLFAELAGFWQEKDTGEVPSDPSAEYTSTKFMAEACLYISKNCTKRLTLDSAAAHVGLSKSHFAGLFKKYTNRTFVEYLTLERIRRAEALSLNPSVRITDIAFEVGFSSISSFNRAFRKIKGISPTEFRAKMID